MAAQSKRDEIKALAEGNLESFIRLITPKQVMGPVQSQVCTWWTRPYHKRFQLLMLPRDHQKSRLVAYRTVWHITNNPDTRVLYISSTSNLAEKQLKFMKDILTSPIYRHYWPDMIHKDEGKRERWTTTEISVDHPKRKEEGVRDPTIFTGGLTTNLVGMHCDLAVMDDVVTGDNAYSQEGRDKVKSQYSLLSSIEGTNADEWVVGTRYHPKDLYSDLLGMEEEIFDEEGDIISKEPIYEVFERQVEDKGDGTGAFIWPRQMREDGKWFGFDRKVLAVKRAQYLDQTQFRAQYYNDPNDLADAPVDRNKFQYFEPRHLNRNNGHWYFKSDRLNIFAAIDFAFSTTKRADYTAMVVIGMDPRQNIYVLDIERIKADKIRDYYELILRKHIKWDIRKLRAEVTAAQSTIVKELKSQYLQPNGIALSIDEFRPMGNKEEYIMSVLGGRYDNQQIWHLAGGETTALEEELVLRRPPHDDIKDALANAIAIAIPPMSSHQSQTQGNVVFNTRFGGVAL